MQKDEGTARIEAFSDGVIAIAMTLLVIQIKVPSRDDVELHGLATSLAAAWPSYMAFLTSFLSILVIWVKHHWMFSLIKRTDRGFLYWNGLLLFFITFLPFPTALLAEYLLHEEARVATNLYAGTVLAISLSFKGLWRHASRRGRLMALEATSLATTETEQITEQDRFAPPAYLIAFALSFVSEIASIGMCLLLPLLFTLRDWLSDTRR